jgi:hypothetical protein
MSKRQIVVVPEERQSETELLARIRQELPHEFKRRYSDLAKKRDAGSLTPEEYQELIRLTDQLEHWQVERVEALADLAELRKAPLKELLQELNLKPALNG